MARTNALGINLSGTDDKEKLAEIYGYVIENVEESALSTILKHKTLSGDPTTGSVEAKRFENSVVKSYGTARGAGNGDNVEAKPVTINIDQDKEIVEEFKKKDLDLYGVAGMTQKRADNHVRSMVRDLDRAFFTEAHAEGTEFEAELTAENIALKMEEFIADLATTQNDFVDGVDRELLAVTLDEATFGLMRNHLDTLENANVNSAIGEFGRFHGVDFYKSNRMPAGVKAMIMVYESVAQPVIADQYQMEKINLSNDWATSLYYSYGVQAVTPDLIKYIAEPASI